jgi:hypothetical protein
MEEDKRHEHVSKQEDKYGDNVSMFWIKRFADFRSSSIPKLLGGTDHETRSKSVAGVHFDM